MLLHTRRGVADREGKDAEIHKKRWRNSKKDEENS
jgi:hypothetical protein